jgi:hypothetical protein
MLRLASSEAKKKSEAKKGSKKTLKERDRKSQKKRRKLEEFCSRKKVTKHGSIGSRGGPEREGGPIGPRIRFSFFFLDL